MSDLSEFLKNWKTQIHINLSFPFGGRWMKKPPKEPPHSPIPAIAERRYQVIIDCITWLLKKFNEVKNRRK